MPITSLKRREKKIGKWNSIEKDLNSYIFESLKAKSIDIKNVKILIFFL